jgi:hypothetical protein
VSSTTRIWLRVIGCVGRITLAIAISTAASAQSVDDAPARGFEGLWLLDGGTASFSDEPPPAMTAWAVERFRANRPSVGPQATVDANDPTVRCLPPGLPYVLTIPTPFELIERDGELLQIFEYDHSIRRIHLDGRARPDDLALTGVYQWMGYSIGHRDGDAIVIETSGFNDRTWLDRSGHPHSDTLTVLERLEMTDANTLVDNVTVVDPKAYREPWHGRIVFRRRPGWELLEHICIDEAVGSPDYRAFKDTAWQPSAKQE